mmetsp:Transcript_6628/g.18940  ORF Transcript_6628/g.18940 Transcript_6628/m.18940 type:complete len:201 (+) Transcript_6628:928-1530(+)
MSVPFRLSIRRLGHKRWQFGASSCRSTSSLRSDPRGELFSMRSGSSHRRCPCRRSSGSPSTTISSSRSGHSGPRTVASRLPIRSCEPAPRPMRRLASPPLRRPSRCPLSPGRRQPSGEQSEPSAWRSTFSQPPARAATRRGRCQRAPLCEEHPSAPASNPSALPPATPASHLWTKPLPALQRPPPSSARRSVPSKPPRTS